MNNSPSLEKYRIHTEATLEWLLRSIEHGRGGSCAYFAPGLGWSKPYPETTGYLIPTLLRLNSRYPEKQLDSVAVKLGEWLLSIELPSGGWQGGLYAGRAQQNASIFNTGQILLGLMALYRYTHDEHWIESAIRGARWLTSGVGDEGQWSIKDYRSEQTPTYYTHVAWPLLEVWSTCQDDDIYDAACRVLDYAISSRCDDGTFNGWGFQENEPAFTHTIAYTLRGLIESARLTGEWDRFGAPTERALGVLARRAELTSGRLPGAFDNGWRGLSKYSCLTGSVQIAECILVWEQRSPDLRLVNAATKLIDYVCASQKTTSLIRGVRGGVPGSNPFWGKYMRFRFPNWSAKYHVDALTTLDARLQEVL